MPPFWAIAFSCVNIATLVFCSCMILLSFIRLSHGSFDKCSNASYTSSLKMSLAMAILSFIGLIGLFARIKVLLRMYIGFTIVLCLVLVAMLQIGFYSMHTAEGRHVEYVKGDEYKLEHFSERAMRIYLNAGTWSHTKKCLKKQGFCQSYFDDLDDDDDELSSPGLRILHPLQGCCKPPKKCGYGRINDTYWSKPETGPKNEDKDCLLYTNGEELCYECDACKAAYIAVQLGDRFQLTVSTIFWFLFCICTLIMACSTLETLEKTQNTEQAKLTTLQP